MTIRENTNNPQPQVQVCGQDPPSFFLNIDIFVHVNNILQLSIYVSLNPVIHRELQNVALDPVIHRELQNVVYMKKNRCSRKRGGVLSTSTCEITLINMLS